MKKSNMHDYTFNKNTDCDLTGHGEYDVHFYFNNGKTIIDETHDKQELAEALGYEVESDGEWAGDDWISHSMTIDEVPIEYWMPTTQEMIHLHKRQNAADANVQMLHEVFSHFKPVHAPLKTAV